MLDTSQLWAKSSGENIADHTLKVLRNLRQICERSPELSELCAMPLFWPRAGLAVCLHDLGKACDGFQGMVHSGTTFPHRHEVLSAVFARWILPEEANEDLAWVAAPVLTHHKNWDEIERGYPRRDPFVGTPEGLDQIAGQMSSEFFLSAERIVREELWPVLLQAWGVPDAWSRHVAVDWVPDDPVKDLRHVLEEFRGLVRRLKQLTLPAKDIIAGTLLRGVIILADHSGSAWEQLQVLGDLKDVERTRTCLGLPVSELLYEHQRLVAAQPGNAILTAPTGSGKTEAALLWTARQSASTQGYPVVYYLLPYQASLNAMRRRLAERFGDVAVTLQHSKAVQALYRQMLDKPYSAVEAQRIAKHEKNLASLYVKPLRISTPYQLLKGAFQQKGHEALWTAAASALFVLDEVHVYETQRLAILLATLQYLCRSLGGKVLVMSATLPAYLKAVLADTVPGAAEVRADQATLDLFCRHEVRLLDTELTDQAAIEAILTAASQGLSVLVVTTTVGRAQFMWKRLREQSGVDVELLHGRFHAEDRAKKENALLAKRGVGSGSGKGAAILVATQVVEVSLNVDFDVLYSDPAPVEALLQRFGRVNRARLVPTRTVNVCRAVPAGCPVYSEALVARALVALDRWNGRPLKEDGVQGILDEVYDEDTGKRLAIELKMGIERFASNVLAYCRPFASDESVEALFDEMFDGYEVLPGSLENEYHERMENQPLLAPGLLVPITRGQYFALQKRGLLRRVGWTTIADCPYTEQGLEVHGTPAQDGV